MDLTIEVQALGVVLRGAWAPAIDGAGRVGRVLDVASDGFAAGFRAGGADFRAVVLDDRRARARAVQRPNQKPRYCARPIELAGTRDPDRQLLSQSIRAAAA